MRAERDEGSDGRGFWGLGGGGVVPLFFHPGSYVPLALVGYAFPLNEISTWTTSLRPVMTHQSVIGSGEA